jgi:16S rRNA (cytidine1402-2'-O)-methyltransferase
MSRQPDNSLYVVATPIGNLKDITLRAIEVLSQVDLIVSEHVRKTRNLLAHLGIKNTVLSYREENSRRVLPGILDALGAGKSVALVAEAGTPGVSDPGRRLVDEARRAGYRVVPVPGASAVVAALSVAGLDDPRFVFEGFLPRRSAKRRKRLKELASESRPLVFFESPHRIVDSLKDMLVALGDRTCVMAREMTKIHEEIATGPLSGFVEKYATSQPVGEFVIVCEGSTEKSIAGVTDAAMEEAKILIGQGIKKSKVARMLAKKYGFKAKELYTMLTDGSKNNEREGNA